MEVPGIDAFMAHGTLSQYLLQVGLAGFVVVVAVVILTE